MNRKMNTSCILYIHLQKFFIRCSWDKRSSIVAKIGSVHWGPLVYAHATIFWGQATNTCKCRGSWSWSWCEKLKFGRTRMASAKCCVAFWWRCRAATVPFGSSAFSFSCLFYSSGAVTANLTLDRWKRQQFGWKLLQQFADFRCALHFIKVYFVRGNPFWILFQRIPYLKKSMKWVIVISWLNF